MSRLAVSTPARRFVSTADLEELHRAVSAIIDPPRFSFVSAAAKSHIEISRLALPGSQIFGVKSTSSVRVLVEELASVYVTCPLEGSILAVSGGDARRIRPGEALIQFAGEPHDLVRLGACTTLFLRLEPRLLASGSRAARAVAP